MPLSSRSASLWLLAGLLIASCGETKTRARTQRLTSENCKKNGTNASLTLVGVATADISEKNLNEACQDIAAYHCERRRFHPGLMGGVSDETFCPQGQNENPICLPVTQRNFDTSVARTADNAADFAAGQSYNYEESICYHKNFQNAGLFPIQGSGDTLVGALDAAKQHCLVETAQRAI